MRDQLLTIYAAKVSRLNELAQDGPMTVATFTECTLLLGDLLRLSVRPTEEMGFQVGLENWRSRSKTQAEKSEPSSTRKSGQPKAENSTQPCRCQCLCHYCARQGIHNQQRWEKPNA